MSEDTDRPQDAGRRHRRKSAEAGPNAALVERYQARMRAELSDLLTDLDPVPQPDGLVGPVPAVRPDLKQRAAIWDLAIKLGRELGSAIDPEGVAPVVRGPSPARRRRGPVDYG